MELMGSDKTIPRVCMVVFSYYPEDVRVRNEAEALVDAGMSVDVICLRGISRKLWEAINGVMIHRVDLRRTRAGKLRYLWKYSWFIFRAFLMVSRMHIRRPYRIVHVHNMPDILIVSAILPKLTGAKIILDLHDPMPELFRAIYSVPEDHGMIRVLKSLENISIGLADLVVTPNISFRKLFISRGCPAAKIDIIMNTPKESVFQKNLSPNNFEKAPDQKSFALMLHGTIEERQGHDTAIKAVFYLRNAIPNLMLHVYGDGGFLNDAQRLVNELNLQDMVLFHGAVSIEQIAQALATIDIGLVPNKRNPFTELNFPTRIFECLIMGKPVIAPRTQGILDYFNEESLFLFEPGNAEDLARKIMEVYYDPAQTQEIVERGRKVYLQYTWKSQSVILLNLYKRLLMNQSNEAQT